MPTFIVKVCGITNEEDGQVALDAGANALGFNFYPNSPRYIPSGRAQEIVERLSGEYLKVGVFVDASLKELLDASDLVSLDVLQLHGRFTLTNHPHIWRAVPASQEWPATDPTIEAYLIDTPSHAHGGSGRTFDWSIAAAFPYRKIVAGGLDGGNVAAAIRATRPWGVDACSRLESQPGKKDTARVRAFVTAAIAAAHDLLPETIAL